MMSELLTFLFLDAVGHSSDVRRLGRTFYTTRIRDKFYEIVREAATAHGGQKEGTPQGDGFMFSFPNPEQALKAAIAMQEKSASVVVEEAGVRLRLRIGVHTAQKHITRRDDGSFGAEEDIIYAARLMSIGDEEQILFSQQTFDKIDTKAFLHFEHQNRALKNWEDEPHSVYELLYKPGQTPREPGRAYLPSWWGAQGRYVSRPKLEDDIRKLYQNGARIRISIGLSRWRVLEG